jgi:hypothetical protein
MILALDIIGLILVSDTTPHSVLLIQVFSRLYMANSQEVETFGLRTSQEVIKPSTLRHITKSTQAGASNMTLALARKLSQPWLTDVCVDLETGELKISLFQGA